MYELAYYIIHCLDTPSRIRVSLEDLEHWHMGPKDLKSGRVKYLGMIYNSRDQLPDNEIGGTSIKELNGNGWDRYGYSLMIHQDGELDIVTPYDDDNYVDNCERTWGVAGINGISRHIALEGGINGKSKHDFFDHFSEQQFLTLQMLLKEEIYKHPKVKVAAHYNFTTKKQCPGFNVPELMEYYGLEKYTYRG